MTDRKQALTDLLKKVEAGKIEHYHWSILGSAMPERTWSAVKSAYHDSMDAAKALHEAMLPGWHWSVYDTDGLGNPSAQVEPPEYSFEPFTGISRVNPARAWLIAILKTLIAMECDA